LVVDEHNIEYELTRRMARSERSPVRRGFHAVEHVKLRRREVALWRTADACLVTSEREEAIVQQQAPGLPTLTVPNGVDTDYFRPSGERPEADTLVFTGLLSYRPNVDAVHYLAEEIFPRIAERRPNTVLTIVGGRGEGLHGLARAGIRFTGYVPDLRPYLSRAAVVLVPLRIGGGTRLKVLEAFATGKAVVSTSLGVEGIRAHPGEHLLVGDTPDAFADHVVALLNDPDRARRMGDSAARLIQEKYSWANATSGLDGLYAHLIASKQVGFGAQHGCTRRYGVSAPSV
jgi:glycosyltransferase involved in cell wall biosynthesis